MDDNAQYLEFSLESTVNVFENIQNPLRPTEGFELFRMFPGVECLLWAPCRSEGEGVHGIHVYEIMKMRLGTAANPPRCIHS